MLTGFITPFLCFESQPLIILYQPSDVSKLQPRAGYTLPVFACAAAIAALQHLLESSQPLKVIASVTVDLLEPPQIVEIPIEQVACLDANVALAITRSDPGDNLDLTRDTPVWAMVEIGISDQIEAIAIRGGEGIGRQASLDHQPAIYTYARRLLHENLSRLLSSLSKRTNIRVTLILPEGRSLAERTSNAAFGVVDGLSLLGTTGISQPLSTLEQLELYRDELRQKAEMQDCLVFCIGENGLDLSLRLGIRSECLLKTANWLGPLLIEAGLQGVQQILLFGYHGKLIKLAGGIFHTHHHVADGRQEIMAAHCANLGLPLQDVQIILTSPTLEAALAHLRQIDRETGSHWVMHIYGAIAEHIDRRSTDYIYTHTNQRVSVGSVLFNRDRQIIIQSRMGATILALVC